MHAKFAFSQHNNPSFAFSREVRAPAAAFKCRRAVSLLTVLLLLPLLTSCVFFGSASLEEVLETAETEASDEELSGLTEVSTDTICLESCNRVWETDQAYYVEFDHDGHARMFAGAYGDDAFSVDRYAVYWGGKNATDAQRMFAINLILEAAGE